MNRRVLHDHRFRIRGCEIIPSSVETYPKQRQGFPRLSLEKRRTYPKTGTCGPSSSHNSRDPFRTLLFQFFRAQCCRIDPHATEPVRESQTWETCNNIDSDKKNKNALREWKVTRSKHIGLRGIISGLKLDSERKLTIFAWDDYFSLFSMLWSVPLSKSCPKMAVLLFHDFYLLTACRNTFPVPKSKSGNVRIIFGPSRID